MGPFLKIIAFGLGFLFAVDPNRDMAGQMVELGQRFGQGDKSHFRGDSGGIRGGGTHGASPNGIHLFKTGNTVLSKCLNLSLSFGLFPYFFNGWKTVPLPYFSPSPAGSKNSLRECPAAPRRLKAGNLS